MVFKAASIDLWPLGAGRTKKNGRNINSVSLSQVFAVFSAYFTSLTSPVWPETRLSTARSPSMASLCVWSGVCIIYLASVLSLHGVITAMPPHHASAVGSESPSPANNMKNNRSQGENGESDPNGDGISMRVAVVFLWGQCKCDLCGAARWIWSHIIYLQVWLISIH